MAETGMNASNKENVLNRRVYRIQPVVMKS
jgi:hypothetical protein